MITCANTKLCCKASKCTFLAPEVEFLEHVISKAGIAIDPTKTTTVGDWPIPKLVHDI